jgi:hypothetical protein
VEGSRVPSPFRSSWYCETSGDERLPYAVLYDWSYKGRAYSIKVSYLAEQYELRFYESSSKTINKEIINILISKKFQHKYSEYILRNSNEERLYKILKSFMQDF